jgi:retron-type reverse transcriptase
LEENDFPGFSENQFGFRPGLGTDEALYSTKQFIYNEIDNGSKVIAIFLDLAKIFDTVNHKTLLQLLPSFEINDRSLNWFRSYITNRKQRIKINNVISQDKFMEYGVLQGNVLGPIFFILYINSICDLNLDGLINHGKEFIFKPRLV